MEKSESKAELNPAAKVEKTANAADVAKSANAAKTAEVIELANAAEVANAAEATETAEVIEVANAAEVSAESEAQSSKEPARKAALNPVAESPDKVQSQSGKEPARKAEPQNGREPELKKEAPNGKKPEDRRVTLIHRLGVVFIVLGLLGLMLPLVNNSLLRFNSQINLHNISAEDMQKNFENAEYFPIEQIQEIGYVNFWPLLGKSHDDQIIGELAVPSVGMDMPIYSSSSNENLLAGAGLLFPNRRMGVGNYTLAGHRARGRNILMHNLMDVEIGKTIYVTNKRVIYAYKVVSTVQKNTDAVEMLDESQIEKYDNSPIVSLMTCYNGQGNSRWFVIGKIAGFLPYSPEALEKEYDGEGTSFLH